MLDFFARMPVRLYRRFARRGLSNPSKLVGKILDGRTLTVADVGAAGGLQGAWQCLSSSASLFRFEPGIQEFQKLKQVVSDSQKDRLFNCGLAKTTGSKKFYVTNFPTGSSLKALAPVSALEYIDEDYLHPIVETTIETKTLEDILASSEHDFLDFIKLDIQGAEIDVLEGLASHQRRRLYLVESEVNLQGIYCEGTTFGELNKLMLEAGLELFDMRIARTTRKWDATVCAGIDFTPSVSVANYGNSSRVWETDVIWFRSLKSAIELEGMDGLRKLIVGYCLYNFFSEAVHAIGFCLKEELLEESEAKSLSRIVIDWHKWVRASFPGDQFPALRRLLVRFHDAPMYGNEVRWQQNQWLPYPHS